MLITVTKSAEFLTSDEIIMYACNCGQNGDIPDLYIIIFSEIDMGE